MTESMTENHQMRIAEARNSFSGKGLTNTQFDDVNAVVDIIHRGIQKSASFYEKLGDYSHALARTENFDQMKAKVVIRDIFKIKHGQTMNAMRESILEREANLPEPAQAQALAHARLIEPMIRNGDTMPFYRAYDHAGQALAQNLNISETGAKELMKSTFQDVEGRDLYAFGKEVEKEFHKPVRDAERASQKPPQSKTRQRA
ncbi:MAG: hypothetical protein ACSHXB_19265 [Sulfitobacter sp.]